MLSEDRHKDYYLGIYFLFLILGYKLVKMIMFSCTYFANVLGIVMAVSQTLPIIYKEIKRLKE